MLVEERPAAADDANVRDVAERLKAGAVAEVRWANAQRSRAVVHVFVTSDRRFYDRELSFSPADELDERERAAGLLTSNTSAAAAAAAAMHAGTSHRSRRRFSARYACQDAGDTCTGAAIACDEKADCTGQDVCCTSVSGASIASSCEASCGAQDVQLCKTTAECGDAGTCTAYACPLGRKIQACQKPASCN